MPSGILIENDMDPLDVQYIYTCVAVSSGLIGILLGYSNLIPSASPEAKPKPE